MTSKRLLEQQRAGDSTPEGGCTGQRELVTGKAFKTNATLHEGAIRNLSKEISQNGHYHTSTRHYIHKKVSEACSFEVCIFYFDSSLHVYAKSDRKCL